MPEPLHVITDSNQDDDEIISVIAEIAEAVHRIDHRTAAIEQRLTAIAGAFSEGGARGLRQALRGLTSG